MAFIIVTEDNLGNEGRVGKPEDSFSTFSEACNTMHSIVTWSHKHLGCGEIKMIDTCTVKVMNPYGKNGCADDWIIYKVVEGHKFWKE